MEPVIGGITSRFGYRKHPVSGKTAFHNGVDIACRQGTVIVAPADGVISEIFETPAGGKCLAMVSKDGYRFGFAHLQEWLVVMHQKVSKGDPIACSGNSGKTTGPHLHFTVKKGDVWLDPLKYFSFKMIILAVLLMAGCAGCSSGRLTTRSNRAYSIDNRFDAVHETVIVKDTLVKIALPGVYKDKVIPLQLIFTDNHPTNHYSDDKLGLSDSIKLVDSISTPFALSKILMQDGRLHHILEQKDTSVFVKVNQQISSTSRTCKEEVTGIIAEQREQIKRKPAGSFVRVGAMFCVVLLGIALIGLLVKK